MQYQNIYTACIDVISSTKIVNEQSTFFRDKFYNSLVETIIGDLKEYVI